MTPTVLLFDIDGTLIRTGGAGRRSMRHAFGEVCDRPDALDAMDFRGMTDGLIFRGGLDAIEREHDPAILDALANAYFERLAVEVPASEAYEIMPHVHDTLDHVRGREGVAVGLGTGNFERGARIKLARAGLGELFAFGGFGDDGDDRIELVRAGAERGAQRLGQPLAACRVVILGDTPRDVHAAKGIGADCVAVATGGYPLEELRATGAELCVPDLSDERVLPFALQSV